MSTSARPRVFVSSTIYDFRDLRSALRFWLEALGYDVQMSDHADFDKPLDVSSYDACLRSIDTCNYFVLLIGSRVGGLYSKPDKVSITRMEYRHAYERFKEGKLTLIPFVRRDVWDIREDRMALRVYLHGDFKKMKELGDAEIDAITMHESKFVSDAEAIFSFIDEVARAEEMRAAVKAGSGYPRGNWINVFDAFEDIADAIRLALGSSDNLRRRTLETSLKNEVLRNLQSLVGSQPNQLFADALGGLSAMKKLGSVADILGSTSLKLDAVNSLGLGLCMLGSTALETMFLDEALRSGEFLEFDAQEDRFRVGPAQELLIQVRSSIETLRRMSSDDEQRKKFLGYGATGDPNRVVAVPNVDLLPVVLTYAAYEMAARVLVAAHRMLSGGIPSVVDKPLPTQLDGLPVKAAANRSLRDVEEWIYKSTEFI